MSTGDDANRLAAEARARAAFSGSLAGAGSDPSQAEEMINV
jgi:hypothetical protein